MKRKITLNLLLLNGILMAGAGIATLKAPNSNWIGEVFSYSMLSMVPSMIAYQTVREQEEDGNTSS